MKKILGLDLGVGSIGWALMSVDDDNNPVQILGIGSRIVPYKDNNESSDFEKGDGESVCSKRTTARTARKMNYRYKMRRAQLTALLSTLGISVDAEQMTAVAPLELWGERAKSVSEKVSLEQLGRILYHINQKRGYRHSRQDASDSKQTKYVAEVNARFKEIRDLGMTVGQLIYSRMKESEVATAHGGHIESFRYRDMVFPREAYAVEVDAILECQRKFYPNILTESVVDQLKNCIFYQRPLKSCKHLVNFCEFATREYHDREGNLQHAKIKVAPRTSPLAQVVRIWESINNIRLTNPHNRGKVDSLKPSLFADKEVAGVRDMRLLQEEFRLNDEERKRIFEFLNKNEKMTQTNLFKELGLKKSDGFKSEMLTGNGLKGNTTRSKLSAALEGYPGAEDLLRFDLEYGERIDDETGEVRRFCKSSYTEQPLYQLWHTIYSITNEQELAQVLRNKFGIDNESVIAKLCAIDFGKEGYTNRSAKFMRELLPYLEHGLMYSEACEELGINHSNSITIEENKSRELAGNIKLLTKGDLRQPVVEKILNQMINLVNALISKYGTIDEARVELARELRQNKEQRNKTTKNINEKERENKVFAGLIAEFGLTPSRSKLQKYRMLEETGKKCMYCGQPISQAEFLSGYGAEVEHIIPRSVFFDDSFSNKTCACRKCNHEKNNRTAYDFMASQGEDKLTIYVKRVEELWNQGKISKTKRDRLLTPGDKIPEDFLNRDLTLTQYITRKAVEILREAIRDVWVTTGKVTDFFRHRWGYDEILHDINIELYAKADKVYEEEYEHAGQKHKRLRIRDWSKRLDHRHHAIDALTVALTRQAYIQKLNNLNKERESLYDDIVSGGSTFKERNSLLTQWAATRPHFTVEEVRREIEGTIVSSKAGKKLTTPGKRYKYSGGHRVCKQEGILVPRGELHEQTIYGKIRLADTMIEVKKAFDQVENIANPKIREAISLRITENGEDVQKAKKTLKNKPIIIRTSKGGEVVIEKVRIYSEYIVTKKKVESLRYTDVDSVIDSAIRAIIRERYDQCDCNQKKFESSLRENALVSQPGGAPIRTVRIKTKLNSTSLVDARKDADGNVIGFAKSGNNHHVAIYRSKDGQVIMPVVSFWDALRRRRLGLPAIVTDVTALWDSVIQMEDSEELRSVLSGIPTEEYEFVFSMQIGDKFLLGLSDDEIQDAIANGDKRILAKHLYAVKKLSDGDFNLKLHSDANLSDEKESISRGSQIRISSYGSLMRQNPRKVYLDVLGNINLDM